MNTSRRRPSRWLSPWVEANLIGAMLGVGIALLASPVIAQAKPSRPVSSSWPTPIEYVSRGEGEAIVLLPGATLTVGYLDGLAEALAKAGYRVVGINFRGSGNSTGSTTGVTLQTLADDVAGVIQALKLRQAHVAGNISATVWPACWPRPIPS